ncbi:LysR family transcriptional regulator [Actinoallomurus purpureus]|uniref:LysR family transcriptional regulator n=1 Tax=Actinoallomurus purpureus TaxID=478114 RepID=UPI00209295F3|nr:LysR family transcriptional regulator [Actinoallomurus purpureus]MCO6008173.1 LysR family transcriptional regulator [Actinoallomurus purpureus]
MDLDLTLVRAFAVTAETLHFGRAAERLNTSQQALSKRIARLETMLAVRLFERASGIRLTEAGERFLPAAHEALAAGDRAVAAVTGAGPVVRIDTWGHLYAPMRTVAQAVQALGMVRLEPGPGRDWPSVAAALLRGDTDLGFGRVHALPGGLDAGLTQRLVRLEPVDAVVSTSHPLAGADELRPADLRDSTLWCPAELTRLDFLRRFADEFHITRRQDGPNLGLDHLVHHIRTDTACFTLFPADAPLPDHAGLRSIPLVEPTPLYAWSLAWRESYRHPLLDTLLRGFAETGRTRRWLDYTPQRDWLPEADHAKLALRVR